MIGGTTIFGNIHVEKKRARKLPSLKLTASEFTPENGWLEYFFVSFWGPAYSQVRTVSFREGMIRARFFEFLCYMEIFLSV